MTMTITQQIITVVVVVLGTMTTRFLPFIIFPEGKEPPAVITYLGKVLPCAVIGLLVVFCLKDVPQKNPALFGGSDLYRHVCRDRTGRCAVRLCGKRCQSEQLFVWKYCVHQ